MKQAEEVSKAFETLYGRKPRVFRAPGRVNLIGEHTDYNDGFVLPMAIDRYTVIAAAPAANGDGQIQLHSTAGNGAVSLDLSGPVKPGPKGAWSNYPAGVIAGFLDRGAKLSGFDALVHSTVPLGGGLSSSAALECGLAFGLDHLLGFGLDDSSIRISHVELTNRVAQAPVAVADRPA